MAGVAARRSIQKIEKTSVIRPDILPQQIPEFIPENPLHWRRIVT
jgi:hypothetical protein